MSDETQFLLNDCCIVSDHAGLRAALLIGKSDRALFLVEPAALDSESCHAAKAGQQKEQDGGRRGRMLAVHGGGAERLAEPLDLGAAEPAGLDQAAFSAVAEAELRTDPAAGKRRDSLTAAIDIMITEDFAGILPFDNVRRRVTQSQPRTVGPALHWAPIARSPHRPCPRSRGGDLGTLEPGASSTNLSNPMILIENC
ncbi:hypothetical protein [Methylosinus sp. PW1]|uniref:hypothetical protein n=1 Tax=Methylosinus sp. PW1 TaxID=107636 RepID=UPI0012EC98B6|nr:hypothetical protein [Methylosinus sp. PW1]